MIAKIPGMRTLSKKVRMQADSLPEIRYGLDDMAFRLGRKFKVGIRTPTEGHFINAAIVVLLGMAEDERERTLGQAFAKINALLAIDEPTEEEVARILEGGDESLPREGKEGFDLPAEGFAFDVEPEPTPKAKPKRSPKKSEGA